MSLSLKLPHCPLKLTHTKSSVEFSPFASVYLSLQGSPLLILCIKYSTWMCQEGAALHELFEERLACAPTPKSMHQGEWVPSAPMGSSPSLWDTADHLCLAWFFQGALGCFRTGWIHRQRTPHRRNIPWTAIGGINFAKWERSQGWAGLLVCLGQECKVLFLRWILGDRLKNTCF